MIAGPMGGKPLRCAAVVMAAAAAGCCLIALFRQMPLDAEFLGRDGVILQTAVNDCGVAALKMVLDRFGIPMEYARLSKLLRVNARGTTILSMKELAAGAGLLCEGWRLAARDLPEIPLPAVLLVHRNHFVVLDAVNDQGGCLILDPARGRLRISVRRLLSIWRGEALLFSRPCGTTDWSCRWFQSCK